MSDVFGPASLAAGQTMTGFLAFLPRLSEVRKANAGAEPEIVGDVRLGEVAASAVALGVGAIASSLSGSPIPLYAAALVALIVITVYEIALRGDRVMEPRGSVTRA